MPSAGDEGYEKLVICPYDRSHEIRLGRLQFHLEKCRKNFPSSEKILCPFNSTHVIPKLEEPYHTREECNSQSIWLRSTYQLEKSECPVKDLVPVNAVTLPDCEESWDNCETGRSVLNDIKATAADKQIYRMLQCESKAKKKNFRKAETARHINLRNKPEVKSSYMPPVTSASVNFDDSEPLPPPKIKTGVPVVKQELAYAVAAMNKQFKTMDLKEEQAAFGCTASDTLPVANENPQYAARALVAESTATSCTPLSYSDVSLRSPTAMSSRDSRPSTALSVAMSNSRDSPSTAMSSGSSWNSAAEDEGFANVPIPGLGRGLGARRRVKQ